MKPLKHQPPKPRPEEPIPAPPRPEPDKQSSPEDPPLDQGDKRPGR